MTRAVLAIAIVTMLAGCRHYWVAERLLDQYATLPPNVDRRRVIVDAVRVGDGKPVSIRANALTLLPATDGPRREVRLMRAETITGIVFLAAGAAATIAGGVLYAHATPCASCDFSFDQQFAGTLLLIAGIPQVVTGLVTTIDGALRSEIKPERRGYVQLE